MLIFYKESVNIVLHSLLGRKVLLLLEELKGVQRYLEILDTSDSLCYWQFGIILWSYQVSTF